MRVSVVMSVYNGLPYLVEALEGIAAQTLTDHEFVIVDDGSTDGSTEVLRDYAARDPRIRLIEQENAGLTKALVRGVAEAKGEYIARQDADDISLPDRLRRQAEALDARPDAVVANCGIETLDPQGNLGRYEPVYDLAQFPFWMAFANVLGGHGQVMFRRTLYDQAGGYDPAFRYAQDLDLWNRMIRLGPFIQAPETLYTYRVGDAASITKKHSTAQGECARRIVHRELERLCGRPVKPEAASAAHRFSVGRRPRNMTWAEVRLVDPVLRQAFEGFFRLHPEFAPQRAALAHAIGERWMMRAQGQSTKQPLVLAAALLNAIRWDSRLALAGPRRVARAKLSKLSAQVA